MDKILFLVNDLSEFDFQDLMERYLFDFDCRVDTVLPEQCNNYRLIVLKNYQKVIPGLSNKDNVMVFHSSDLPDGKGWAPIYNTIVRNLEYYTVSGIIAQDKVDSGDVVAKARFRLLPEHTASMLRIWDDQITFMLIAEILKKYPKGHLIGRPQAEGGTFYKRRLPENSEVQLGSTLQELFSHLRACEKKHPAFVIYKGVRYLIEVRPEPTPDFPKDLEFVF